MKKDVNFLACDSVMMKFGYNVSGGFDSVDGRINEEEEEEEEEIKIMSEEDDNLVNIRMSAFSNGRCCFRRDFVGDFFTRRDHTVYRTQLGFRRSLSLLRRFL